MRILSIVAALVGIIAIGCESETEPTGSPPENSPQTVSSTTTESPTTQDDSAQEMPGLSPGATAPDFVLKNQDGKDVSLKSLLAENNVALVFYRSADW